MKENSIKETKKQLELILKVRKEQKEIIECAGGSCMNCDPDIKALVKSIDILSDYKKVLKINEVLLKENEEIRIKNNAIKRESEAYAEHMIRLDNELNLEKEKSKYEWIRQNCLSQELVNKLYIPIQKVKDKIKELEEELEIMKVDNMYGRYKEYGGKTKWERLFATKYGMHDALQELLEGRK